MNNYTEERVNSRVINEAADWLARIHGKALSEEETRAWKQWLKQSPEHQRVWSSAEQLAHQFGRIEPTLGISVLDRPRTGISRRKLLGIITALTVMPSATWFGIQLFRANTFNGYRTATGERREVLLADSSLVVLNTASALDVKFNGEYRSLQHLSGEIYVKTSSDNVELAKLPFIVETENGRLRALGTRFAVRNDEFGTRISVFEGAVEIVTKDTLSTVVVESGRQVMFTSRAVGELTPIPVGSDAWKDGVLYAQGMRLADFTKELTRYRVGLLYCSPAIGDIPVSGAFQLADTDKILQLLADTLPVKIDTRTRYWVTINPL
ncbi:MAG TPA: FecR domain-containing protein [Cellvibrio sp.]|nr:FecR domain-containing protein [Cellvibrio sp.]